MGPVSTGSFYPNDLAAIDGPIAAQAAFLFSATSVAIWWIVSR